MQTTVTVGPSTSPTERRLAAGLAASGVVLSVIALAMAASTRGQPGSFSSTFIGELGAFTFAVTVIVLGMLIRARRPDNGLGWLFIAFGLVATLSAVAWSTMLVSVVEGGDRQLGAVASLLGAAVSYPAWVYLISSLALRFPSGNVSSAADAMILRWAPIAGLIAGLAIVLRPGPIAIFPAFDNPIPAPPALHDMLRFGSTLAIILGLLPGVAAGTSVVRRYRRAARTERLQLRWFAFGAAILVTASILYIVLGTLIADDNLVVREATYAIFVFSACSLPIAVFVAITRHRLYDIDMIIGRTVAYGALTAILAGIYAASVRGFNAIFVAITGEQSEAALVLTTLVLATTFTPIKNYLERLAEKRFPSKPPPGEATVEPDPLVAPPPEDLDARIETIARRVATEVLAQTRRDRPPAGVDTPKG